MRLSVSIDTLYSSPELFAQVLLKGPVIRDRYGDEIRRIEALNSESSYLITYEGDDSEIVDGGVVIHIDFEDEDESEDENGSEN